MKRTLTAVLGALILGIGIVAVAFASNSANANDDAECVPAWTEVIEHPAETHEEVKVVIDKEAWVETIPATDGQHYSLKGNSGIGKHEIPEFPADYWQANTHHEPHGSSVTWLNEVGSGLHYASHGSSGKRDWFYYAPGSPEQAIEHPAQTHEETVLIVDKEPWTETIEHPAQGDCSTEEPTEDPEEPLEEPDPETGGPDAPDNPDESHGTGTTITVERACLGEALVTKTYENGVMVSTDTKNGAPRCAVGTPEGPAEPVKEEGF